MPKGLGTSISVPVGTRVRPCHPSFPVTYSSGPEARTVSCVQGCIHRRRSEDGDVGTVCPETGALVGPTIRVNGLCRAGVGRVSVRPKDLQDGTTESYRGQGMMGVGRGVSLSGSLRG